MDVSKFEVLLYIHILAAITTLGPVTLAASWFPRLATTDTLPQAKIFHKITIGSGTVSVFVPIFGLLTANEVSLMNAGWVQASIGVFLGMLIALFTYIIPEQRRVIRRIEQGEGEIRTLRQLQAISGLYSLGWAVVLYFMVAKPL